MIPQLIILAIFVVLGIEAWAVLQLMRRCAVAFLQHAAEICRIQTETFQAWCNASERVVEVHIDVLGAVAASHTGTLASVTNSHGVAAAQLASATDAHNTAAQTAAKSTAQLRAATERLNTTLNDSQMQQVVEHLGAIKRFWVKS